MTQPLDPLFEDARLIAVVGTGGVGKTTTSAALALRAAVGGRRVLVLTIDPARRLANAMGIEALGNEPQRVDLGGLDATGRLDAMMLDATASFDALIRRTAGDRAGSILDNRVYRVMADHFAGVQEYMALDRLYDLRASGDWDLVVLDTPPAQNASDFFTAPQRVSALFDERIMRWFVPGANDGNLLQRVFNPGAVVLKLLAMIGGQQFIDELAEFFEAIRIVRAAFKDRGDAVQGILREPSTRYVIVASPDPRRVLEALTFHTRMGDMGLEVARFVLNRSHHRFRPDDIDSFLPAVERIASGVDGGVDPSVAARAREVGPRVVSFYRELVHLAERDRAGVAQLTTRVSHDLVRLVPVFGRDIHTLGELLQLARFVVA